MDNQTPIPQYITSRKNPLLQQVRRLLSSRREREQAGLYVGDGIKLLQEAVAHCKELDTVILSEKTEIPLPAHIHLIRVPEDVMASLSPMETPQGALFLCRLPEREAFQPVPGMLVLDGIQDPGNLGTILRTADAFNVPVVLLPGCADPYSHKVVRASMGAVFRTPVCQAEFSAVQAACREAGIPLAVTALSGKARDIRTAKVGTMAVVIGSEGQGVSREVLNACDEELIIPMNPHCESLNAAVAATVVMWQMQNEREKA